MALNIKDPDTDRLARELAALTGESITTAINGALTERLRTLRIRKAAVASPGLADIVARGRARAVVDARPEDDILGYDAHGLPQ